MNMLDLNLPRRTKKPREHGHTLLIDNGVPLNYFRDVIQSSHGLIDFVKFGWGTSIVTEQLDQKIACLKQHKVNYFFGGTLFEKCLLQGKIDGFYTYCKRNDCQYIEISNGTVGLSSRDKASFISDFAQEFSVLSEVGSKIDTEIVFTPEQWLEEIQLDLAAGASKVITEARESGTSGICHKNGELKDDLIKAIAESQLDPANIIFEAPNKTLQTSFIQIFGPNVNLGNIPFTDPIALETLRLGLRSDTLFLFEEEAYHERAK